jgi:metal-responsive CopG/Arc/MetJ family transcriptional regulator
MNAMSKTTKIAISLPEDVLDAIEKERNGSGESRSLLFRRAVELLLRQRREKELNEQYISAYRQEPETEEEIEASRRAAGSILSEELWK